MVNEIRSSIGPIVGWITWLFQLNKSPFSPTGALRKPRRLKPSSTAQFTPSVALKERSNGLMIVLRDQERLEEGVYTTSG
jgi:hypothetical protein